MQRGFSLVELSIVLVILGLLTGGILAGQSLIKAAQLRAVPTEIQRNITAVMAFRDKYLGLPGDITNAARIWGAQTGSTNDGVNAACAALTSASPATGTPTCNGNGDNRVEGYERQRLWQQLANAGLIEGTFTGVESSGGSVAAGINAPASRYGNSIAHNISYMGTSTGSSQIYDGEYGHLYQLLYATDATTNSLRTFIPEDQWNVDTKMDDGLPHTGLMKARPPTHQPDCTVSSGTRYNLAFASEACNIMMRSGF